MQVSVEVKQGLQRNVSIQVPADELASKYQEKLLDFAKNAKKVDGFRPGRMSPRVVEQKYGKQVRAEVIQDEITNTLTKAMQDNNLRPVTRPKVDITKDGMNNSPLIFTAEFEVFPEVKLDKLSNVSIEEPKATIDDKLVEETLGKVSKQVGGWEEAARGAKNDDLLTIDYDLQMDELEHDKKHGHNFSFVLGAGQMISGFDEQLIGAKAGEERMLDVVFPAEYHEPLLAGKPMKIAVKVHKVSEKREATQEELCKMYNIQDNNIDELKNKIRNSLEEQAKAAARVKMKEQLLDQLLTLHPVQLPESLVTQEQELLKTHQIQLIEPKIKELESTGLSREEAIEKACHEEARRKVALSMLLGEYIREHDIKPDNQRVFDTVQEITRGHQQPMEMTKWFFEKEERIQSIVSFVLEEQAVDSILEQVDRKDKAIDFDDLMKV
jgi:trigger factor